MLILKISNKKFLHFFNSYVSNEIINLKNNPKQYVLHDNLFNYKWVKILPIHYLKSYEELISQNIINSMNYAEYVLQSRFELGEPIIATDAYCAYEYARYVLKERFELGELTIQHNPEFCAKYIEFLKIKYQINNQNKASSVLENIITSDRLL